MEPVSRDENDAVVPHGRCAGGFAALVAAAAFVDVYDCGSEKWQAYMYVRPQLSVRWEICCFAKSAKSFTKSRSFGEHELRKFTPSFAKEVESSESLSERLLKDGSLENVI